MAKIAGHNARVLLGSRDLSPDVNQATLSLSAEAPEATGFTDTYRVRLADGIRDVELTVDGFFNSSASKIDSILFSTLGASALTGLYFTGLSSSKLGREFTGILTQYEPQFALADAAAVSFTVTGASAIYHMTSLGGSAVNAHDIPTISGVGGSDIGSVDLKGAADTTNDSYISIRLLTLSGTTPEFSASVQYSADDTAWTTAYAVVSLSPASIGDHSGSLIHLASASRYARVAASLSGTSPCATFAITCGSVRSN